MLEIIRASELPKRAEDIYLEMEQSVDLSTIYRGLDFLAKKGLIKSILFEAQARYYYSIESHTHFVYCLYCNKIETFDDCMAGMLQEHVQSHLGFFVEDHVFFFTGMCAECQKIPPVKLRR